MSGYYKDKQIYDYFSNAFDKDDAADMLHLSRVHRAIFGFFGLDIEAYVQKYIQDIDLEDRDGKTPLQWSIERRENATMRMLLRNHASVKPSDLANFVQHGHFDLKDMELFLQAGADVNHIGDEDTLSAFHKVCLRDDPKILEYFLAHGADLDSMTEVDHDKYIPLGLVANRCHSIDTASTLISAGAAIKGERGLLAFIRAVEGNCPKILHFFLEQRVNYRGTFQDSIEVLASSAVVVGDTCWHMNDATILHVAAYAADLSTLEILTGAKLRGLGQVLEHRDTKGYTPWDYLFLRLRRDYEPEDDDDSSIEELYDTEDDEDYTPSQATSDVSNGPESSNPDDENGDEGRTSISCREDEAALLTEAFEAFLASLKAESHASVRAKHDHAEEETQKEDEQEERGGEEFYDAEETASLYTPNASNHDI